MDSSFLLVRRDENGKLYLYDIIRIKKKRADRFSKSCTVVNFVSSINIQQIDKNVKIVFWNNFFKGIEIKFLN